MTAVSVHPTDEQLGRFVEGTLDPNGRARVVEHLADCDECRVVVVNSAELIEEPHADRRWWLAVAAGLVLVAAGAMFTYNQHRDPLVQVVESYAKLKSRPVEARLSGFPYVPRSGNRGTGDEVDPNLYIMQGAAAKITELPGTTPKVLHAQGVALLVEQRVDEALIPLQEAAAREPGNAKFQSDFAAALIAAGRRDPKNLERALAASDRALQVNDRTPEALFNRALALDGLGRSAQAIAAYEHYLAVDRVSPWAAEAGRRRDALRGSPAPR